MPTVNSQPSPLRPFLILGSLVLVIAALSLAQKVLIPVALAILFTFILTPAVTFLQHRGLRRVLAVVLVMLLALSLMVGLVWALTVQVEDLSREMAQHSKNISKKIADLQGSEPGLVSNFLKVFNDIGKAIQDLTGSGRESTGRLKVEVVNYPSAGLSWVPSVARPVLEVLASAGLVVMLVIFMLVRREDLRNRLLRLIGHGRLTVTTRALDEAAQRISRFLLMQLAINTGFGVALGVGLLLLGVPYAFLWGFLALVLRFVPYVGTWVAALLPLTISVAMPDQDWLQPVLVLILFAVLEVLTANVIEPLLFSHSTGISSIALLVSAAFWTWLWGPIGLVLSAPMSVCLAVLGRYVPPLEFFDVILGDEPVLDVKVRFYQRLLARDQDEAADLVEDYLTDHPYENVYDEILLPALLYARRDRESIGLPEDDEQFIYQTIREILDEVVAPQQEISLIANQQASAGGAGTAEEPSVLVFGCPARDEGDEMALRFLEQLLRARRGRTEVLSPQMLTAEVIERVKQEQPALVCIGSLPPGGLAQARYLCKRLRAQFPDLKIVVGRWGQNENVEKMQERVRAAGANFVATTFLETRAQMTPFLDTLAFTQPHPKKPAPEPIEAAPRRG